MTMPTITLTRFDLADRWGVHVNTIDRLRAAGRGPDHVRIGKSVRYRIPDVERWEAEQQQ